MTSKPPSTPNKLDDSNVLTVHRTEKRARTRNPVHKTTYNRLPGALQSSLQDLRKSTFETYLSTLSTDDQSVWKATKKLNKPTSPIPPLRKQKPLLNI